MKKNHKKVFTFIIIFLFILGISSSLYLYFSGYKLEDLFHEKTLSLNIKIIIILILYFFRNYLFIPSTFAILFAGYFLQDFWITLIISIIGVSIGIFQTYFVGYVFGEDLKENKNFQLISKYNEKIKQNGFKVIFGGSLVPIIPVDILYYSAGLIKYNVVKAYLAGILGELPLIILYVYLGKEAYKYSDYILYVALGIGTLYMLYFGIKKLFFKK
ncbi:MAG: VTT domain-containing protein [Candidatus Altimarinota bacterium]